MRKPKKSHAASVQTSLTTGYYDIDAYLGGFHRGDMVVLASLPDVDKSALALGIVTKASGHTKRNILFFTTGMNANDVAERICAIHTSIPIERLRGGALSEADWERISAMGREVWSKELYVEVFDSATLRLKDIERACRRRKPALVVVDYFNLLEPLREHKCAITAASELSRGIKRTAKRYNVAILVLANLDRSAESRANKTPLLSDLKDSGCLEYDADVVLLLHRQGYCRQDADLREAQLIIAKNCHGRTGSIPLVWQEQYCRFDIDGVQDAE